MATAVAAVASNQAQGGLGARLLVNSLLQVGVNAANEPSIVLRFGWDATPR
jgi:hypothetical protein